MGATATRTASPGGANGTPSAGTPGAGTPAHTLTYAALGASDGVGIGTIDPRDDNWPTVLATDLGQGLPAGAAVHLLNLGIPGATVAVAAKMELPVALDAHPNLVTVWLAVNDFADAVPQDTYAGQLQALLATLRAGTHAPIFVADLPDLTLLPYFSDQDPTTLRARVAAWNVETADVVAAEGAHLVDLFAGWRALAQHPEYVSYDGLHPSTDGAIALAGVFAAAIHAAGALTAADSLITPVAASAAAREGVWASAWAKGARTAWRGGAPRDAATFQGHGAFSAVALSVSLLRVLSVCSVLSVVTSSVLPPPRRDATHERARWTA